MIRVFSSFAQRRGEYGEQYARKYLEGRGFTVIATNEQVGRGEIDIIASKGCVTHFFEVKAGFAGSTVDPVENITKKKKQRFLRAVLLYCQTNTIYRYQMSFLVVYMQRDMKTAEVKVFPFEW